MSCGHSLLMSAILNNPAKAPWQEMVALQCSVHDDFSSVVDTQCVAFHPSGNVTILSLKKAVYRIFIFGLAMAQRSESRVKNAFGTLPS